jgi:hypothetical protein
VCHFCFLGSAFFLLLIFVEFGETRLSFTSRLLFSNSFLLVCDAPISCRSRASPARRLGLLLLAFASAAVVPGSSCPIIFACIFLSSANASSIIFGPLRSIAFSSCPYTQVHVSDRPSSQRVAPRPRSVSSGAPSKSFVRPVLRLLCGPRSHQIRQSVATLR